MPRRSILTDSERDSLFTLPDNQADLIRHYSLNESDLSVIRQHRGAANKIGFAIQLCYMRYPGTILPAEDDPGMSLLQIIAQQIRVETTEWARYACRDTSAKSITEAPALARSEDFDYLHLIGEFCGDPYCGL